MKEEKILYIIKSIIGDKYIGDDCAYLKDLGIVISQDNLVQDIHFSLKYMTPYELGYKSAMVNISDIAASGGEGKYITVGLSLPKNIEDNFIKDFYLGLNDAAKKYNIEIIGGDITGSDKIMISVTIIGNTYNRKISSRSYAKSGHVIVTSGIHGSSAYGLNLLQQEKDFYSQEEKTFINSHILPEAQVNFSKIISENIKENYSMMDSSDGLADVLYKIAEASNKTLVLDFDKILFDKNLKKLCPEKYIDYILYGGEDYQLISTLPLDFAKEHNFNIIGYVKEKTENCLVKIENINGSEIMINNLDKCFNHFEN